MTTQTPVLDTLADLTAASYSHNSLAPRELMLDYTNDPLIWDAGTRTEFLGEIARLGDIVEQVFGAPQDIEGAFVNGRFHVVQSRPQVGLHNEKIRPD